MNFLLSLGIYLAAAFVPIAAFAANAPLTGHEPIEILNSRGGFGSLEVDAAKDRLLLAHLGNGTLDVIDLKTEKFIKQLKTGAATGIAVNAAHNRYYVSVGKEKKLVIIDRDKLVILGDILLPGEGGGLVLGPRGVNRVFVGHADGPELWVIDPVAKSITSTLTIPAGPGNVLAEDDTGRIYLTIKSDDTVQVISASDQNSTIGAAWSTAPAKKPRGLAIDLRAERRLFVAGINGKLAVLKADDGKLSTSVDIVTGVDQIAFDAARERLYCPSVNGRMTVLDTRSGSIFSLGEVATARGAKSVAVDPSRHSVWLAYTEEGKCFARKFTPTLAR